MERALFFAGSARGCIQCVVKRRALFLSLDFMAPRAVCERGRAGVTTAERRNVPPYLDIITPH
jgi:hypothetical protein